MREYFRSILSLAEVLLRSSQPVIAQFACAVYRFAFVSFDAYCRQVFSLCLLVEIVYCLLNAILKIEISWFVGFSFCIICRYFLTYGKNALNIQERLFLEICLAD